MDGRCSVELLWVPLGAGDRLPTVRWSGRVYERLAARRAGRSPERLYHAALEIESDGARWVIEMAPAWQRRGVRHERAAMSTGPVGLPWLGRWRWFRYEVRCGRDGALPDRALVVGRIRVGSDVDLARRVIELTCAVPPLTWGRDEAHVGEMWNSNSVVAWLLATAGTDVTPIQPPAGGRAPGWTAGLALAVAR